MFLNFDFTKQIKTSWRGKRWQKCTQWPKCLIPILVTKKQNICIRNYTLIQLLHGTCLFYILKRFYARAELIQVFYLAMKIHNWRKGYFVYFCIVKSYSFGLINYIFFSWRIYSWDIMFSDIFIYGCNLSFCLFTLNKFLNILKI